MVDNKYSVERGQISKNDEVKVSYIIEDLKVVKLSSHKYVNNVKTESDIISLMGMNYDKDSAEIEC